MILDAMEFSLRDTLESGQVFRYRFVDGGAYFAHGDEVHFLSNDGTFDERISSMFRMNSKVPTHNHPFVKEAIEQNSGLRIIKQDPWECLVAFIISQNNHQKRIQANVLSVSTFGRELSHGFHAFPKPHELPDEETLRGLGLGYRAGHIAKLRDIDLNWLYGLSDLEYEHAKKELMTLASVGPKVADCILLFSLGFDQACPEDTWIKKIFKQTGLTREDLGPQAGIIQQYLFHHARSKKLL